MILCVNKEFVDEKATDNMRVVLQADTAAEIATKPMNGENVEDVPDDVIFYPASILVCLEDSKKYVLGGDKTWHEMK